MIHGAGQVFQPRCDVLPIRAVVLVGLTGTQVAQQDQAGSALLRRPRARIGPSGLTGPAAVCKAPASVLVLMLAEPVEGALNGPIIPYRLRIAGRQFLWIFRRCLLGAAWLLRRAAAAANAARTRKAATAACRVRIDASKNRVIRQNYSPEGGQTIPRRRGESSEETREVCGRGGTRTRTRVTPHRILNPERLPIPPLGRRKRE